MKQIWKWCKRISLGFIGFGILLALAVWIIPNPNLSAQSLPEFQQANQSEWKYPDFDQNAIDSLRSLYGENKIIPPEIELPVLLALSFYPEFNEVEIEFKLDRELFPYSSRPNASSFLGGKRAYTVRVANSSIGPLEALLYPNVPLNALVGVLAHELAHVWFYETQTKSQLWQIAINYLSPAFSKKWENLTDKIAIHKGAGSQILAWAEYTSTIFDSDQAAKEDERYMSVGSIIQYMKEQE